MSMEIPEILNFEDLIMDLIPKDKKYVSSQKKRLTAPGDNYASLMLAITITAKNEEDEEETIHTVAKLLPPNLFMMEFMNVPYTVRNELHFYKTIIPVLKKFQQEQGCSKQLEFLPEFHGGRMNLDPSVETLDANAVILLENLKVSGFVLGDKIAGFEEKTTKMILTHMAELHASVLALKEEKPKIFQEKVLPFFEEFRIFQMGDNEEFMTSDILVEGVLSIVQEDDLCLLYFDKIEDTVKTCVDNLGRPKNAFEFQNDVFASLIHADLWVNNIMVRTNLDKTIEVKLLDWQLYEYASVTKDILFFICSSAQETLLENKFDDLIRFYYESLIEHLKELKCDTKKFGFNVFEEELKNVAGQVAYFYVMMALPSILASGGNVLELDEISKEKLLAQVDASEECKRRICLITRKFIQKNWI